MPSVFNHLATSLPSLISDKCEYPPPGKTTIAAPVAVSFGARYGVIVGMSCGSLPTAFGAPFSQREIGVCALTKPANTERTITANTESCFIYLFCDLSGVTLSQKLVGDDAE